jgi:hypothetical protein
MQSWGFSMNILGNFAEPFMVGSIKVWPCASRPGFQHGSSLTKVSRFTFRSRNEAILFARDRQSIEDPEQLCD